MEKKIKILKDAVETKLLPFVRRPARYIGGEINQVRKDLDKCDVRVALCFPDVYEVGMSHTGMAIIYTALNNIDGIAAERVFSPWIDAEKILRAENIPLFTLESKAAVADFDIIGFSLTNELCYTNMLNTLDLAGLNIRAKDRTDSDPLIIVGGQASNCAEPLAPFVDMFVLGEGEEAIVKIIELWREEKNKGTAKVDFLYEAQKIFDFVYVPSLYEFEYEGNRIKSFTPVRDDLPVRFENAVVKDLDNAVYPTAPIVPFAEAVHERVSVEIMRGCPGRCRFCQASFSRRPIRYRSIEKIFDIAKQSYLATGFDTVSLLSLSTADYPDLEKLALKLTDYFQPLHVGLSLPSLKVQAQLQLLPKLMTSVRKSGLTIAVEAASERLREVINKPITDEDLLAGIRAAYEAGFMKVKLYFMVGLPEETQQDIINIVELSDRIARLRKEVAGKVANVNVAVSWLVPKPHTPFQWLGQKPKRYFEDAKQLILKQKKLLNAKYLNIKFHEIENSILESTIGRGDRRLADVIESAWRNGAKFDLWSECFDYSIWQKAFTEHNLDPEQLAQKQFSIDDILPWFHLGGPKQDYLLGHYQRSISD